LHLPPQTAPLHGFGSATRLWTGRSEASDRGIRHLRRTV